MVKISEIIKPVLNEAEAEQVIILVVDENVLLESKQSILLEEKFEKVPGSQITARYDAPNTNTKTHGHHHFLLKGNELYAVNNNGMAHHKVNRGITIDKSVADYLLTKGVPVPNNRILEFLEIEPKKIYRVYLLESA